MSLVQTTAPLTMAISLAAAKDSLRIEQLDTALDAHITRWIKGITLEAEHQISRSLVAQGWRLTLDAFPSAIRLDRPPILAVASISYYDSTNVLRVLSQSDYTVDLASTPGYVVPAPGKAWPGTFDRINAVSIEYTAGYGVDDSTVPVNVQMYILARLAEQFDPTGREFKDTPQSRYADSLLDRSRNYA